ncbi:hypothetical protein SAMN05443287_103292 [Micromonospora phaseoli]|uniref:Uncharacterized protein n=1 Tax=Micromonospora phaseoli TaxID=1144548 RepID=A0A1H6WZ09_9ACTN|nr:hypothetical protein [Micromonospora phaseoli]PZW01922.1 hypothetical protein CLV64_102291 [Micromonospora phaseoli]GIJ80632.1 hypothetical protein Xph01_50640 [Micromonospora phaseoli]SEJ19567.1 hypothetical protein SAMN05443287_103292 [Micromonospora phaseoli]
MGQRWRAVGVLAIALFAVNVVARLVIRFGFDGDDTVADRVSLGMFVVIGLILAGVAFVWGGRRPLAQWAGEVASAVGIALGLTVLVGPLLVGNNPFAGGGGTFFAQIGLYLVASTAGTLLGYLLLTTLGRDYRSRSLQRYAETAVAKPRRIVRR